MSRQESAFCRSTLWRGFATRVVLPWALQGQFLDGDVLEIGAGSGAMAGHVLARHPSVRLTVTDVDEAMVAAARARLASFGERAIVRQATRPRCRLPTTASTRCCPSSCCTTSSPGSAR